MSFKTNVLVRAICLAILVISSHSLFAQKNITGRIINSADKQPIAGATIEVKGTKLITQTNNDGVFSINAPNDNSILLISVVGFEKLQFPLAGKTTIGDISL